MSDGSWRPSADLETLKARHRLLAVLRAFFNARGYLEVETPQLSQSGTVDPNINSLALADGSRYLHSSPEFAMKRLLAAGSGPIYQICRVFREDESGRLHNPEFSLLEWYRPGFDHHALMNEIDSLLCDLQVLPESKSCQRLSYAEAFQQRLDIDPHVADMAQLRGCAEAQGIVLQGELCDKDAWLDLLMAEVIGPGLGLEQPCFIYDYPASQAALSRIRPGDPPVAERFELYWHGVELANGFHELCDAAEQRRRMQADVQKRLAAGLVSPPVDEYFLQALEQGLPDCAGVALGIDRLLMLLLGKSSLPEVLSFDWRRA